MAQYGFNTQVDLDGALSNLPGQIYLKLRDTLDLNPADKDWRALIRIAETDIRYKISPATVEAWSNETNGQGSCKVITKLGSLGMTVRELANYLVKIGIDTYELGLSPPEDIEIISKPPESVDVYEGSVLCLAVEATGLPFPKFQWFFCRDGEDEFKTLVGRTGKTLVLDKVTSYNAGAYSCRVHNCTDPAKVKLLDHHTLVSVVPNPLPYHTGLNSQEKPDIVEILSNLGPLSPSDNNSYNGLNSLSNYMPPSSSDHFKQRTSANLIVRHPRSVTVGMNESFILVVETHAGPPVTYRWYRNGQPLNVFTQELRVKNARPDDFGNYHCVVNNGLTVESSNTACVKDHFPLPERLTEIVMISQPKSVTVRFGGSAIFTCEAKCCQPLKYQWFKDGKPLKDEKETEFKLRNIQDRRVAGMYQCEISVDSNNAPLHRLLTSGALLTVEVPAVIDNIEFNPSDKVALLIGNFDYKSEQPLTAPITDVQILSESFNYLNFKVVSLLNLTKPEIENAVVEFCHLVDKNVYAVFYFCGHGFEEDGLSFFVPTDAPSSYKADDCVCADSVLENIQKKDPPFVCMIMDICRKPNRVKSPGIHHNIDRRSKGNTVFCYATSIGLNAYEYQSTGLLVKHLAPLLRKHISIYDLTKELSEEFNRVKKHSDMQIPEFRSNLLEPRRSLADIISHRGETVAFQKRNQVWSNAHEKPPKQDIRFSNIDVVVQLDFQSDFSNVLNVFAIVIKPGHTQNCLARVVNYPPTISEMHTVKKVIRGNTNMTITYLQDIQKLQSKLTMDILLSFEIKGRPGIWYEQLQTVDLGYPLVSKLHLWKQPDNSRCSARQPMEQAEDFDSI